MRRLDAELVELQSVNADLQLEVDRLQTDAGLTEAAREELGYIEPPERRLTMRALPDLPTNLPNGWPYRIVEQIIAVRGAAEAARSTSAGRTGRVISLGPVTSRQWALAGVVVVVAIGAACDGPADEEMSREAQIYLAAVGEVIAEQVPPTSDDDELPVVYVVPVGESDIDATVQAEVAGELREQADVRFADDRSEAVLEDEDGHAGPRRGDPHRDRRGSRRGRAGRRRGRGLPLRGGLVQDGVHVRSPLVASGR